MLHLTPDQIKMIKETWEIPNKDLEAYGEEIFYRFFKKYPHNQQKFVAFKDIDVEKLKVSFMRLTAASKLPIDPSIVISTNNIIIKRGRRGHWIFPQLRHRCCVMQHKPAYLKFLDRLRDESPD